MDKAVTWPPPVMGTPVLGGVPGISGWVFVLFGCGVINEVFVLFRSTTLVFFLFFFNVFVVFSLRVSTKACFRIPFRRFTRMFDVVGADRFDCLDGYVFLYLW